MIEEKGEIDFSGADDANIPVNIYLLEPSEEEDDEDKDKWCLMASNFMPRKNVVIEGMYIAVSEKREELVELIRKYIIPLYESAVKILKDTCDGKGDGLYNYWG